MLKKAINIYMLIFIKQSCKVLMPLEYLGFYMYIILLTSNDNFGFLKKFFQCLYLLFVFSILVFLFIMLNRTKCKHTVLFCPDSPSRMDLLPQLLGEPSVGTHQLVAPFRDWFKLQRATLPKATPIPRGLYPLIMDLSPAQENLKGSFQLQNSSRVG